MRDLTAHKARKASPDLIAAISTSDGPGAISVIRLSGDGALDLLNRVFSFGHNGPGEPLNNRWEPRRMYFGRLSDPESGALLDEVLAVFFPGPKSFTGEDMAEIQGHGGRVVTALALQAVLGAGARLAEAGEFTRRAFLNGRLDLTQAEAIADLVSAQGEAEAALAARQLSGGLSGRIKALHQAVFATLADLTADIDFGDDLEPLDLNSLAERLKAAVLAPLEKLLDDARAGRPYREGLRLALVGAANVGKSSLFNCLAGADRAMVSPAPGTTRDFITTAAAWEGLRLELCDTAGLSERPVDELDAIGQSRSLEQLAEADLVLWIRDCGRPGEPGLDPAILPPGRTIEVWNKIDLAAPPGLGGDLPRAEVSAKSGLGLGDLKSLVLKMATGREDDPGPPEIVPNLRHQAALSRAGECIRATLGAIGEGQPPDICALELKAALEAFDRICGRTTADDILNEIFSRFCLGK